MLQDAERDQLARLRAGDHAAFELLFRTHYSAVAGFAYSYVQARDQAEEIAQTVFIALWDRRDKLDIKQTLRAYLLASVRNQALNRSARARVEQRWYESTLHDTEQYDVQPADEALIAAELTEQVRAAIAELPPGCRRVLQLRWYDQLSHAEIADVLSISVKGVENQLARAKRLLRERLADLVR
jgi:RNA polymerase sigma-70 factor (ECF subfamily)